MKTTIRSAGLMILGVGLLVGGCATNSSTSWGSIKNPEVAAQLKSFVLKKETQANMAAKADRKGMPPEYKTFFAAAERGDWPTISRMFWEMGKRNGAFENAGGPQDMTFRGSRWEAVREIWGAFDQFCEGGEKYSTVFGKDVIDSIPSGSVYFGGSDPGRFIVTAMCKSQIDADPFFVLSQNQLVDSTYLQYLRSMYGEKIYVPSSEDLQKSFHEYTEDVCRRFKENQLKPGENVKVTEAGVQVSGRVALMGINALLAKVVFDKNPGREFYIEESFPLDWMYPYLEPHGLSFKLNRQPLPELSDEIIRRDHDYWTNCIVPIIGDWLNDDTTIGEIAAFAEKVYVRHDVNDFSGDPRFVRKGYWLTTFSTERCAIAELYAWRAQHAASDTEKKRMQYEADFAFRQGWALCPISPEAVYRYVNLLASENRMSDAILVVETALKMPQMEEYEARQVRGLLKQLEQMQQQQSKK
jgi:hypothetical protein